jgi:hypothetical protein
MWFICTYFYYLCSQEVEEETGSAGEQPVNNKLPALHCNNKNGGWYLLSSFVCYRHRPMAKKTYFRIGFLASRM